MSVFQPPMRKKLARCHSQPSPSLLSHPHGSLRIQLTTSQHTTQQICPSLHSTNLPSPQSSQPILAVSSTPCHQHLKIDNIFPALIAPPPQKRRPHAKFKIRAFPFRPRSAHHEKDTQRIMLPRKNHAMHAHLTAYSPPYPIPILSLLIRREMQ
jgi:hypothetical protein